MTNQQTFIHPTAIVEKGAEIDAGVFIGPYSIVGPHVKLGKNCKIHSHVVLAGHTTLGEECEVFSFAAVGNIPQDKKYAGEVTYLQIGSKNVIREAVTMQPGTVQGGGKTIVGDGNLLMAYSHVAHDCLVGNDNVIANAVQLAGHVTIRNKAIIGGSCAIHQFVEVGDMAMLAGGSILIQDLPPYCIGQGDRAFLRGLNVIGMQRNGIDKEVRNAVRSVYKILFTSGYATVDEAIAQVMAHGYNEYPEVQYFINAVKNSKRGVVRPSSNGNSGDDE